MEWTREQLEAITESGRNLLVAAAAGAGKTAVLVERIIRRITDRDDPVDIDSLMVVTFTNAAATEMRERIGDALEKALDRNPGSTRLQRQLSLLSKATITTMHSFCLEVIRNNFHRIDIDPGFRVADETETVLMKLEALEEMFEGLYEDPSEEFLNLVEWCGGRKDDRALQQLVLWLYDFVQSYPWPEDWLREKSESFNLPQGADFGNTEWAKVLAGSARIELEGMLDKMKEAVGIIRVSRGLEPYIDRYLEDFKNIESLISLTEGEWDRLRKAFLAMEFGSLPRRGKQADETEKGRVTALRNGVKAGIKKMKEELFALTPEEAADDIRRMYPFIKCLSGLVTAFGRKYSAKKREKSVLDFNDLEHYCLEALTERDSEGGIVPSEAAMMYRERFKDILVDEYQDSNLVQEVIVNTISGKENEGPRVFVVGDVKQSIYRFRQARPELFLSKYKSYSAETGSKDRKIMLYRNFRSREDIINAVNLVFGRIMSVTVGELDYTAEEALNPGAEYPAPAEGDKEIGGPAELHIIDRADDAMKEVLTPEEEYDGDEALLGEDEPDAVQSEAILIARRIRELVEPPAGTPPLRVYDRRLGSYRDAQYRDIVVLLRATRDWAEVFMEEFSLAGIPVYADTSTGYFQAAEIQVMISLLQIIDNPMQDIPLLAVLKSPVGAFTPEELMNIRLHDREVPFYMAMKGLAENDGGSTADKAADFLDRLDGWRERARNMSTDELIWYLFSDTNYYSFAGAMPGGLQRQANLRMLYERARQYEETSYRGLFNFINFINSLKSGSGDLGSARMLGENENVVRVMSIHKSKGLEFPVVIVAGCGKSFNFQDMNRRLLVHHDLGFGPDYVDPEKRIAYPTLAKQALRCKLKLETLSEEMRILYVAFTRAREKLIVTGSVRNLEKAAEGWQPGPGEENGRLAVYRTVNARNYLDWLGPCLWEEWDNSTGSAACEPVPINHGDSPCGQSECRPVSAVSNGHSGMDPGRRKEQGLHRHGCWDIKIWNKKELSRDTGGSKGDEILGATETAYARGSPETFETDGDQGSGRCSDEIIKRLEWEYRYKEAARLPVKLSVTELKRRVGAEFAEEYLPMQKFGPKPAEKPSFLDQSRGFSAAERGSILHFVMQHLDLEGPLDREGIKGQVAGMVSRELITPQEAQEVDSAKLEEFFGSKLGQRLLKADRIFREVPFNLDIRAADVYRELDGEVYGEETILLQGVIDCCFEEDGKMILVDYKTDRVKQGDDSFASEQDDGPSARSGEDVDRIKEKYRLQVEYYALALERITGKPVTEKYLYLFDTGQVVGY
jgi:ATP-dependent helicase/nuclease subunit A